MKNQSNKQISPRNRVQFSCVLSEADNDLIRDYRFTQIMTLKNTELTLADVVDEIFISFRAYLDNPSVISPRRSAEKNECRMVLSMRAEDYELLKEFRLKKVLTTQDINISMTSVFCQLLDIFRQTLKDRGDILMSRPSVVRDAEVRKRTKKS